jgi:hypothetical protein
MLNTSYWNYRHLINNPNGPIEKISYILPKERCGFATGFEALSYLNKSLGLKDEKLYKLYGNADGSGWDINLSTAVNKSISEALERWAFLAISKNSKYTYGFDIDSSSTGLSAYPSLIKRPARNRALNEAIERWALSYWWSNALDAEKLSINDKDVTVFKIKTPWKNRHTLVCFKEVTLKSHSFVCYGFSTDNTIQSAFVRAKVELVRNYIVLEKYYESEKTIADLESIYEKRLVFFSTSDGFNAFKEKVNSKSKKLICDFPKLLIDAEIPGPWTKYATVWRCLLESKIQPSEPHNDFLF